MGWTITSSLHVQTVSLFPTLRFQPTVKQSISKFMAFVHTSVNQMSQSYLSNEQRYNYTTPKSFLEFIRLYQSLLRRNGKELRSKMERLENGLLKLHSTSAQVGDYLASLLPSGCGQGVGAPHSRELEGSRSRPENHVWFSRGLGVT